MKKVIFTSLLLLFCGHFALFSQTLKPGHLSVERVLVLMPEMDGIRSELSDFEGQLSSQINVKTQTFQSKLADYQKLAENLPTEARLEREKELESLDSDLRKFRADAQQAVLEKENRLLEPVYKRIQEAIDAVSKEHGFTQIFRSETLLYTGNSVDIFDLMVAQLELEVPESMKQSN